MSSVLPISLRPNGRHAVIVGGGNVATRKTASLVRCGFPVFVVAPRIDYRLQRFLAENDGISATRGYQRDDLKDAALVVAATDDDKLNARIVADARDLRVLVCDAAVPERGDFTMNAAQKVGNLTISVDSDGTSPAFAARLVAQLAQSLGPEYDAALAKLAQMRRHVKENFAPAERAGILRALAQLPVEDLAALPEKTAVCATRRSALASIQSRTVAAGLARRGIATTMLGLTTHGDRHLERPIEQLGTVNVFVKELEEALRDRRADYAVHSCKDLPGVLHADFCLAAISRREDPRDAYCSARYSTFESLPAGAVVGTASPRRRTQLSAMRPDLRYCMLRGNVDTRLRKLREGQYDAIVLAMAGIIRLGAQAQATYVVPFDVDYVVPAVGQGALAVEARVDDTWLVQQLRAAVNDQETELCVECERAALRAMRAGCSAPLGIHAYFAGPTMRVLGVYAVENGPLLHSRREGRVVTLDQARALGVALATEFTAVALPGTGLS